MTYVTTAALPPLDEAAYSKRRRQQGRLEDVTSFWFLLPILAIFVVLFLVPLVQTAYYSLTDFNGYSMDMHFVGLSNYQKVFSDPSTLQGLGFTLLYAITVMIGVTVIAIPLAVALNQKFVGCNFVRSVFFFFSVPSLAIMGMVWKYIFSPMKTGVVNSVLSVFGLGPIPWLSNNGLAKFCVIFIAIWAQSAGMQPSIWPFCRPFLQTCTNRPLWMVPTHGRNSPTSPCRNSCQASSLPHFCS